MAGPKRRSGESCVTSFFPSFFGGELGTNKTRLLAHDDVIISLSRQADMSGGTVAEVKWLMTLFVSHNAHSCDVNISPCICINNRMRDRCFNAGEWALLP